MAQFWNLGVGAMHQVCTTKMCRCVCEDSVTHFFLCRLGALHIVFVHAWRPRCVFVGVAKCMKTGTTWFNLVFARCWITLCWMGALQANAWLKKANSRRPHNPVKPRPPTVSSTHTTYVYMYADRSRAARTREGARTAPRISPSRSRPARQQIGRAHV